MTVLAKVTSLCRLSKGESGYFLDKLSSGGGFLNRVDIARSGTLSSTLLSDAG